MKTEKNTTKMKNLQLFTTHKTRNVGRFKKRKRIHAPGLGG